MRARSSSEGFVGPTPPRQTPDDTVRLLAPFDPVVWDRRRFELLWGWSYRFEAYTPAVKRKLGDPVQSRVARAIDLAHPAGAGDQEARRVG